MYDHNEVFPNDAPENAVIYDRLDNTDDEILESSTSMIILMLMLTN